MVPKRVKTNYRHAWDVAAPQARDSARLLFRGGYSRHERKATEDFTGFVAAGTCFPFFKTHGSQGALSGQRLLL